MSTKLEDLTPDTQGRALRALADLRTRGIPYVVTYTFRTYEEQAALYAQGRKSLDEVNIMRANAGMAPITEGDNNIVTQRDGIRTSEGGKGRSAHQLGTAIDVVPMGANGPIWPSTDDPRWRQIAQSFKAQGFTWGGDWTDFPDFPHYQVMG